MDRSFGRGRWLVTAAMSLALVGAVALPAGARAGLPLVCQTAGAVNETGGPGVWNWDIQFGFGQCFGDGSGPYIVQGTGSGTSTGLGLCDGILVKNLKLNVTLHLASVLGTPYNKTLNEIWSAPLTTFPLATPFLISDASGGTPVGGGVILTRIGLKCPPAGTPGTITAELRISPS
jgi:hypothetical protein